ncbi:LacI family transcriptional regulator [Opitutaceae bacterium TAV5]|nr:LacI family transcriptional regulator [Opitutaceae bacterium TAV5]
MDASRRVTQRDIAERAKVHRATVSLALRDLPCIPAATRARIQKIATELGYEPDPMLSALATYRERQRPVSFHGNLAWLVNTANHFDWQHHPYFSCYFKGAEERARRYGFQLEIHDLHTSGMTPDRLARILRARNISGILLCPQPSPGTELEFPWQHFSAVTFGYTLSKPGLHTVVSTQYRAALTVMRELRLLGYRRIGCMMARQHDLRADHNYLAGYLVDEVLARQGTLPIPPWIEDAQDNSSLSRWLKTCQPDALLVGSTGFLEKLQRLGLRIPDEIGVACPCLRSTETPLAGVAEPSFHIGEVAVDFLVAMVHRNERGIPDYPQRLHVEGRWHAGLSVRAAPEKTVRGKRESRQARPLQT